MTVKSVCGVAAAASLAIVPVAANAASAGASVAAAPVQMSGARVAKDVKKKNGLDGGSAVLVGAAVVAVGVGVYVAVDDDDNGSNG